MENRNGILAVTEKSSTIQAHTDFENHFVDLTLEPFVYEYNEEEDIEGHRFVHVRDGVFRAEPVFRVSKKEIKILSRTYRDVEFYGFYYGDEFEVWFALSETGCMLDSWDWYTKAQWVPDLSTWKWWEESDETEVKHMMNGHQSEFTSVKFERGEFYIIEDEEDEKPLPEKKNALNFIYKRTVREDGTVPRIMINGFIGDMVEPGIYYFHERSHVRGGGRWLTLTTGTSFGDMDVAAVANFDYGITTTIFLHYVALDKKYFSRLKEIAENMDDCFYHEFRKIQPKEVAEEREESNEIDYDKLRAENEKEDEERKKERGALGQKLEGEELIAGLGTENIELCFEIPLVKKSGFKKYEYALKQENFLILVTEEWENRHSSRRVFRTNKYDMRLMSHLEVKQCVMLNCGYEYDVIHKIIDCTEEKYKEILTPEAYALYQEQWKEMQEEMS